MKIGGQETTKLVHVIWPYCKGRGVDFGCELDPAPNAQVLVDGQQIVYTKLSSKYEVHIRDINKGFDDWEDAIFDFAYSSHLIEHLRDPIGFLKTSARIVKPGGHIIVVGPHEDWYWPNGHPEANPDHKWWHLNPRKVLKWLKYVGTMYPLEIVHVSEHGPEEDNWSFVVVARRIEEGQGPQDRYVAAPDFVEVVYL